MSAETDFADAVIRCVAAAKGRNCTIFMPQSSFEGYRKTLEALGEALPGEKFIEYRMPTGQVVRFRPGPPELTEAGGKHGYLCLRLDDEAMS